MDSVFESIKRGLEEAVAYMQGCEEGARAHQYTSESLPGGRLETEREGESLQEESTEESLD
jgi:hypothetical protein